MPHRPHRRRARALLRRQRSAWLAFAGLACAALACVVPPNASLEAHAQSWATERGPVVPHDSFPADCSLCHAGGSWHSIRADFRFDHGRETGVVLRGAHVDAQCLRCHNDRGPVALFAARGCGGCHLDPHRGLLAGACEECHDERSWAARGARADHARTRFPLVGAHSAVACERCHPGANAGNFLAAALRCEDCHAGEVARATDPDHTWLSWTHDCDRCHTPTGWTSESYRHVWFVLSGAHATLSCTRCHTPDFVTAEADCASCHADEYAATTRPSHEQFGYELQCQHCHTTARWAGAGFDHPLFPIDHGAHADLSCGQCHPYRGAYGASTCVQCHAHERRAMNVRHEGVNGYTYDSEACYVCHPSGNVRR